MLLAGGVQSLLVPEEFLSLVLDLCLDTVDSVRCLNVQGDGLDSVRQATLNKDQHGKDLFELNGLGAVAAHNCVGQMLWQA